MRPDLPVAHTSRAKRRRYDPVRVSSTASGEAQPSRRANAARSGLDAPASALGWQRAWDDLKLRQSRHDYVNWFAFEIAADGLEYSTARAYAYVVYPSAAQTQSAYCRFNLSRTFGGWPRECQRHCSDQHYVNESFHFETSLLAKNFKCSRLFVELGGMCVVGRVY